MGKKEQGGFKVPEGYFEQLHGRLQQKLQNESDMSGTSESTIIPDDQGTPGGELDQRHIKTDAHSGFRTPDGYFQSFGDRLQQRMKETGQRNEGHPAEEGKPAEAGNPAEEGGTRIISMRRNTMAWTAAVAAAILLAIVLWPASKGSGLDFDDLADAEIEQYLEVGYEDISAYELAETLPMEQLDIDRVMEFDKVMDTETQEQQLLEYLDNDPEVLEEIYLEEDNQ